MIKTVLFWQYEFVFPVTSGTADNVDLGSFTRVFSLFSTSQTFIQMESPPQKEGGDERHWHRLPYISPRKTEAEQVVDAIISARDRGYYVTFPCALTATTTKRLEEKNYAVRFRPSALGRRGEATTIVSWKEDGRT